MAMPSHSAPLSSKAYDLFAALGSLADGSFGSTRL